MDVFTGIFFYLVVTPLALLIKLFRRDPLKLKFDPTAASYWIERKSGEPNPESMGKQF
ncbi:MAG: hypothetical protein AB7P04_08665 [Bacteriovoracia bacterium]